MGTRVSISDNFRAQFDAGIQAKKSTLVPCSSPGDQTMEVQDGQYHQEEFSCRDGISTFSEPHSLGKGPGILPQDKSQQKVSRQAALVTTSWE
ncbi:hypothetical protein AAES_64933 [Amazona aestiva]|uniref:Uncharacterized protein n=1 Tax=Amazona aestiva TaxID=12930 RepID=A0A0Q3TQT5_AMAAE|nr:hypothetical protein AAES_64933 [Amazona aestiva]